MKKLSIGARILVIAVVGLILTSVISSYQAMNKFEAVLAPALESKAKAVGESVNGLITKLMRYGVPFDRLRGLDKEFAVILADNPEISYIRVRNTAGELLYSESSETAEQVGVTDGQGARIKESLLPIFLGGEGVGTVYIGQNAALMADKLREILYDIITVVIVAILMAVELLLFLTAFTITSPMQSLRAVMRRSREGDLTSYRILGRGDEVDRFSHQVNQVLEEVNDSYQSLLGKCQALCGTMRQSGQRRISDAIEKIGTEFRFRDGAPQDATEQRLIFVRPPLFLLIFSESMSLSFFPIYVESLYEPIAGIPKDFIIGLPISLFMLIWAFSLPSAGQWSDRVGRRKSFMFGAIITAVGLLLTGISTGMMQLLVCRCLTAIGYALVFITAQGFVTDNTTPENRTKGMAIFLSGFFSGALCGAAIGGILATRIGYQSTFLLSASLAVASALFVYQFVKDKPRDGGAPVRKLRLADLKTLLANPRFMTITFLTAIPAKVCLTGFLYYTAPIYLDILGSDSSTSGRILMGYGLAIILISPLTAQLADRFGRRQYFVVVGGLISGGSFLAVYFAQSLYGMLAAVSLLGLAHGIGISPQLSLITALPQDEGKEVALGATIGIFRLIERLGSVGGPILAASWIRLFGFGDVFLVFGAAMVGITLMFALLTAYFEQSENRNRLAAVQGGVA